MLHHYRTEVEIALDRYVCLQLPRSLPTGRAVVTIQVLAEEPTEDDHSTDLEPEDHQDIEWWEEFEEQREQVG